jgi:hypothetical protein
MVSVEESIYYIYSIGAIYFPKLALTIEKSVTSI